MKLENAQDLFFVLSVFVPGFIYNSVLCHFIPLHQASEKTLIILRLLTATAFNYALASPIIYFLATGTLFNNSPVRTGVTWFCIIFILPILLACSRAKSIQSDWGLWLYRTLRLRPISPIPTGWDWIFGRTNPCYVIITLTDGTEIAGFFGSKSMASSDPERRDIYIERVFKIPDDGGAWTEVESGLGMHVAGTQIAFIEFRS